MIPLSVYLCVWGLQWKNPYFSTKYEYIYTKVQQTWLFATISLHVFTISNWFNHSVQNKDHIQKIFFKLSKKYLYINEYKYIIYDNKIK